MHFFSYSSLHANESQSCSFLISYKLAASQLNPRHRARSSRGRCGRRGCISSWMAFQYDGKSFSQSVILQALSSLPLQSIPLISAGPDRIASVVKAINDHFYPDQPIDRYERLQRAALRLEQQEDGVRVLKSLKVPSNYTKFSHPDSAIELITANLLYPASPDTLFDAVLWGKIFQVALLPGIDWLEIDHEKPSRLWSELLRGTVSHHDCDTCDCDGNQSALFTFPLQKPMPPLSIAVYEMAKSETSLHLVSVLNKNMRPSFLKWLLHVGYSNVRRSAENHTISLPDDLFLFLNMLQTPSIQKTSSLHKLWIADNATLIRHRPKSLFRLLLDTISDYTIGSDIRVRHRQACCQATIIAMKNVLKSPSFGASTIMTPEDEASIVGSVFKGLNWSLRRFGDKDHDFSWLTPELTQRVLHVAFKDSTWLSLFVGNIFLYLLSSSELLPHVPLVYSGFLEQRWLQGLSASLDLDTTNDLSDSRPPLHRWVVLATAALAGLYVDGLAVLGSHSSPVYLAVMKDLCISRNLLTLCKVLLISDVETQLRLQKLVKIAKVGRDCWEQCAIELVSFSVSEQAEYMHSMLLAFPAIVSLVSGQETFH
ncbi:hypothetical protein CPB85DRAFT_879475 [Mucidula mucida]|nr:hypothetical protein CPB85DRAFT_879475 [Mucidula mucida]